VTGRGKNREYRRLVQKIIFFSIKAKRKVESLSAQFKKAQEKYNRYKGLFLNKGNQVYWQISYQYLVPQSKYGSLPSIAKRSEYTTLVRGLMI
jgi:hypothetical protein